MTTLVDPAVTLTVCQADAELLTRVERLAARTGTSELLHARMFAPGVRRLTYLGAPALLPHVRLALTLFEVVLDADGCDVLRPHHRREWIELILDRCGLGVPYVAQQS